AAQPTTSNPASNSSAFTGSFAGDGTYYTPGLGSCGLTNTDSDLIAAINAPQYGTNANPNNAPICGQCALVKGPKGQVKVKITDRCPVCKHGDLDLSPSAFEKVGDFDAGRIQISWSFVAC
ncbi:barwin-like endoglucanase, partial [Martensiomyces pterosporus]